ncbi:MAG: alpha/beta hydrolase [Desertifilum sp. SIO1I2]|nr:alpha/beta hydrolase [Desertifilum sp. SIO1I2]
MATIDILGVPHAYDLTPSTASPHTVVFIHGWLLSRGYWQPVIERLAGDYQCLSYDLRGFGDSLLGSSTSLARTSPYLEQAISGGYTPKAYAKDLMLLLEQLGIDNAWLVGHSLGGSIALWGAALMPECVRGVVCVNAGGGIYLKEEFERFRAAGQQLLKRRPRWLCQLPLIDLLFMRANVVRPIERAWARQRIIDFVVAHPEAALGALLDSTTEEEVHHLPQLVSKLEQPVYFIAGDKDTVMNPKYVRHLASFHRLFQEGNDIVIEIPNCGHLSMVEHPEIVEREIRQILSICSSTDG